MVLAGGALVALAVYRGRARGPGGYAAAPVRRAGGCSPRCRCSGRSSPTSPTSRPAARFAYLVLFAVGVAMARLAPRAPDVALGGVLVAALAVVAYALASRVWPATPGRERVLEPPRGAVPVLERGGHHRRHVRARAALARLAPHRPRARARARLSRDGRVHPRDPAHAVARSPRRGRARRRSPGSRSSRCGCAASRCCWRPPLCAGLVGAWALSRDPFTKILQPLAAKESVAGDFGLLILLMSVVLLLVGLLVNAGLARAPVPMRRRRAHRPGGRGGGAGAAARGPHLGGRSARAAWAGRSATGSTSW